jgi:hypothetical protein
MYIGHFDAKHELAELLCCCNIIHSDFCCERNILIHQYIQIHEKTKIS